VTYLRSFLYDEKRSSYAAIRVFLPLGHFGYLGELTAAGRAGYKCTRITIREIKGMPYRAKSRHIFADV